MKRKLVNRLLIAILAAALAAFAAGAALAESYAASTMRLLRYEGSVQIEEENGEAGLLMENIRFRSGQALRTGENSLASVSLDTAKIVTLDAESRVAFNQEGGALRLELTQGSLFLDVSEKLGEGESLEIRTSTMAVGIRGTIVFVSEAADPQAQGARITTLGVLEGTAEVAYLDESGASRTMPVPAGRKAVLRDADGNGRAEVSAAEGAPEALASEDIPNFAAQRVMEDAGLLERVRRAIDVEIDPYPADGDWMWNGTVTLVAQSASKLYDGSALMRPTDVLVYGLPAAFSIDVSANGAQTDAGESANPVARVAITNARGEDVTRHFTDIRTVSGQLVVDPAPLTVWTGSAEKIYDGEPLVNPETALTFYPGYEKELQPWRNMSYVVSEAAGGETLYGLSGVTWVHGTNPLTGESREIELQAGQKMTVYLSDENDAQSIEFRIEAVDEAEIPEELLRLYADNPELMAQACADAGWDAEIVARRVAQLPRGEAPTVQQDGLRVEAGARDRLMNVLSNVRINIDTQITNYNGRALGSEEARYTGVHVDDTIVVTATGSQTEVGESPNTYEIDWGSARAGNYILGEELGTLRVLAPGEAGEVTLTAASAEKVYDGTPLTDETVEAEGLPEGYACEAVVTGSQTDAGESENVIESYRILDADGADVTDQFADVTVQNGTLKVEALKLDCDLGGTTAAYNGVVMPEVTITYANGEHAGETVQAGGGPVGKSASPEAAVVAEHTYALFTGDSFVLTVTCDGAGVGTHTLTGRCSFTEGIGANYALAYFSIEYTVEPAALTIATGSASKAYDGAPLVNGEVSVTGLAGADEITVAATGTITAVGEVENGYEIDWGEVDPENYALTEALGTLKVTANEAAITFTASTAEKTYDGEPLRGEVSVTGLPEGFGCTATAGGSRKDAGESENPVSDYAILNADGEDVTAFFTNISVVNGTLTVRRAAATVTTGSASKVYDGKPLTAPEAAITGLVNGESAKVKVTGSLTDAGTATNTYEIDWGNAKKGNYRLTEELGTLTVKANDAAILFTADSAEKVYDGAALTAGGFTVAGLPEGFTGTAEVTGSRRKAGEGQNDIDRYAILNAKGEDVTANFTNIATEPGTLKVVPAEVTVATGSASKVYDGRPLTSAEATITGLAKGDSAKVTATGAITDAGIAENTYEVDWGDTDPDNYVLTEAPGALEITPLKAEFDLYGYEAVFLGRGLVLEEMTGTYEDGSEVTRESLEFVMDEAEIPAAAVAVFDLTGGGVARMTCAAVRDAGTHALIPAVEFTEGSAGNYEFTYVNNEMTVAPLAVEFDLGGWPVQYDGAFHGGDLSVSSDEESFTVEQVSDTQWKVSWPWGDAIDVTITGGGKNAGEYPLSCGYAFASGSAGNYDIALASETLTVTKNDTAITFTAPSLTKEYDGTPLTGADVTAEGLPEGYAFEATATGSRTEAGTADNVVSSYRILDPDGGDATANFSNVTAVNGKLDVWQRHISMRVDSEGRSYVYDGQYHSLRPLVGFRDAGWQWQNHTPADQGGGVFTYTFDWGDVIEVRMARVEKDAGEYSWTKDSDSWFTWTITTGDPDNYVKDSSTGGSLYLTIAPAAVKVETPSASKIYDGTPLSSNQAWIHLNGEKTQVITGATGSSPFTLVNGETATLTVDNAQTEVGSCPNACSITWDGTARADNYAVEEDVGTLEVYSNNVLVFDLGGYTCKYDGEPHGPKDATAKRLDGSSVEVQHGDNSDGTRYARFHVSESEWFTITYKADRFVTEPGSYSVLDMLESVSSGYSFEVRRINDTLVIQEPDSTTEEPMGAFSADASLMGDFYPAPDPEEAPTEAPPTEEATPEAGETPAPMAEETPAPVEEETPAPMAEETPAPVEEETPAPTGEAAPEAEETPAPTGEAAPEAEETPAPAAEETPAPVEEETPTPVEEETPAPVEEETPAPAAEETPAPVEEETPAPAAEETPAPTGEAAPEAEETPTPAAEETPAPIEEETPAPAETPAPVEPANPADEPGSTGPGEA